MRADYPVVIINWVLWMVAHPSHGAPFGTSDLMRSTDEWREIVYNSGATVKSPPTKPRPSADGSLQTRTYPVVIINWVQPSPQAGDGGSWRTVFATPREPGPRPHGRETCTAKIAQRSLQGSAQGPRGARPRGCATGGHGVSRHGVPGQWLSLSTQNQSKFVDFGAPRRSSEF